MNRVLNSVILIVLVARCSPLAIQRKEIQDHSTVKQAANDAVDRKLDTDAATMDDLEELRKNYGMILDHIMKKRSHPFGWGIMRRYKSDAPSAYGRFGPASGDAIQKTRGHPFGFSITPNNRFAIGDHPFGFGLGSKKDSIPSNTQAFHGRRRDMMVNDDASSMNDLEGAKRLSEWLDEKIRRE